MQTENPLQNAYIGEYTEWQYEYSYTFKWKTVAQIQADWFSLLTGTIKVNSNWVTWSSTTDCRIKVDIPSLANAKKITISWTDVVNTSTIAHNATSFLIWVGSGWGTWAIWMNLQGSTYTWVYVSWKFSGTGVHWTVVWRITANWTYKPTIIIDLENKIATGILSWFNNSTLALTDAQVAEIRTFTYLCPYTSVNHSAISDISITIE